MPFDRSSELFFLRQFLSPNYAQLAMLVGLLLVVIFRPERIQYPRMFRLACVLLAVSILVCPLASAIIQTMSSGMSGGRSSFGSASEYALLFSLIQVIEPILVGLSVCLGLFSLLPPGGQKNRPGPTRHPLDP